MVNSIRMQLILQKKKELEELAKAEKEKLEAQALEADISSRGQVSDVEFQRQKALQEARTSERKEQRKIDLPITKPKDIGTKSKISQIESAASSMFSALGSQITRIKKQKEEGGKAIDVALESGISELKTQEQFARELDLIDEENSRILQEQNKQIAQYNEQLAIFKSINTEVAPNKWYNTEFWNSLTPSQKAEIKETGTYTIPIPANPYIEQLSEYKTDTGYNLVQAIREGHINDVRKAADAFGLSQLDVVDLQIKAADIGVQNYINSVISDYNTDTTKGIDASILRLSGMNDQQIAEAIAKGTNVTGGINIRPKIAEAPIVSPMSAKEQFDYSINNKTIPTNAVFDGDSNDGGFMYHIPSEKLINISEISENLGKNINKPTMAETIFPNPAIQDPETYIKTIWRELTPWDENAGQTFLEYSKKQLDETLHPVEKTQEELKLEYDIYESKSPWEKFLSGGNHVFKSDDGTYSFVYFGVAPGIGDKKAALISGAGAASKYLNIVQKIGATARQVKTIGPTEAGLSEASFNNFLKLRVANPDLTLDAYKLAESMKLLQPKVSNLDWNKLTKLLQDAIKSGDVKSKSDIVSWIDKQAKITPKTSTATEADYKIALKQWTEKMALQNAATEKSIAESVKAIGLKGNVKLTPEQQVIADSFKQARIGRGVIRPETIVAPAPTGAKGVTPGALSIIQQVGTKTPVVITPKTIDFVTPVTQMPNQEQVQINNATAIILSNAVKETTKINIQGLTQQQINNIVQQKFNESIRSQVQQITNPTLKEQVQNQINQQVQNIQIQKVDIQNQIEQIRQQKIENIAKVHPTINFTEMQVPAQQPKPISEQQKLKIPPETKIPSKTINFTPIKPPERKIPEKNKPPSPPENIGKYPIPKIPGIEAQTKDGQIIELSVGAQIFKQGRFYKAVAPPYTKLINLFERPKGVPALETGEVYVVGGGVPQNVKIDYGVVDIEIKNGRVSYIGKGLQTNVSGKGITKGIGISNIPSGEPTLSEAILLEEDIKPIRKLTTVEEFNSPKKKKSIANNYINSYDELKEMYSIERSEYLNEIRQKAGY